MPSLSPPIPLDAASVKAAVARIRPDPIINELTSLRPLHAGGNEGCRRTRSQGPNRRERKTSSRPCGMRVYAAICCKAPVNGMRRVPVSLTKVRSPRPRPRCSAPTFSHKLSRRQDTASRPYTSPFCSSVNLSALTCKKYKKHIASFPLRLFLQNILLVEFTWVMRLYANFVRRAEANRNKDVSEVT
jgi:hypothetical protein